MFHATFEPITTSGADTAPGEISKEFLLKAESQIKEEPAHYLWTHKRWKHRGKQPTDH